MENKNIYTALFAAQKQMSNATKGAKNPFFKSTYADLNSVREAVMPSLFNEGILCTQIIISKDNKEYVRTSLIHAESGTQIDSDVLILMKTSNDPQAQGSAITYARRYGLQSICGIGAEDDDGNKASYVGKKGEPININDTDLLIAETEAKEAKTIEDLTEVWNKWSCYKGNPSFKALVTKRGKELK